MHEQLKSPKVCAWWVPCQLTGNKICSEWACPCSTSIGTLRKERTSWHELLQETSLGCTTFNQNRKDLPWNMQGVILQKFQPYGENVNAVSYHTTLRELQQAIRRKKPGLLIKGVILLDDNTRSHPARVMQELLRTFHWDSLEHPLYSPDLAPSDFHLLGPLKIIWVAVILQMMMP